MNILGLQGFISNRARALLALLVSDDEDGASGFLRSYGRGEAESGSTRRREEELLRGPRWSWSGWCRVDMEFG